MLRSWHSDMSSSPPQAGDTAGCSAAVVVSTMRLVPSGLLLATFTMPTIVPPPGRFSTTIVLPMSDDIRSASTRPAVSVEPPGP